MIANARGGCFGRFSRIQHLALRSISPGTLNQFCLGATWSWMLIPNTINA
jgi:hypothetical protein